MASNPDFVQFIIDQCSGAGEIAVRTSSRQRFPNWLRRNSGMTFRDAVDAYRHLLLAKGTGHSYMG